MKKRSWGLGLGFFILLSVIMFSSLSIEERKDFKLNYSDKSNGAQKPDKEKKISNPLNTVKLVDNEEIYSEDEDSQVDKLYVTVLPPQSNDAVTLEDLNANINNANKDHVSDDMDPVVEIVFSGKQLNKDNNSTYVPNATMEIRGQSSRFYNQKSYKIKLFDNTEKWKGFKTINLNKHSSDPLRIRNKLSFDYFEMLPDFVSLRTRFVELYIRDLSSENQDDKFRSYGLFTFIEQSNKRFLKRHNLDPNAQLYKAEYFEFFRYPDKLKTKEDITYDNNKFEEILEMRGNDDHKKLIEMLEAVNNYNRDINEVVDKYFDRDNLLTWVGVNILINNYDTNSRNFLLYSPLNSDKWFFIPWDYDGAWSEKVFRGKWRKGLSTYWGMVLFNRFFKDANNVEELSKKIEELSNTINEENTSKFLDSYYGLVKKSVFKSPDVDYIESTPVKFEKDYYSIAGITEKNKKYYYESLENPMPFFLGEPKNRDGSYSFNWSPSYDLQADDLSYEFILSSDYEFKNIIVNYKDLKSTNCKVDGLNPGEYFWKVIAYDSKGNWQEAFDLVREDGKEITGSKRIIIQ
ncbi:CotH kinase family protein [Wukongibacter baidiensis]|uniref:CotH kinase family protein n=1 Tax=Wukongibacter baidiensis TaxID=1723361 RepID=UPI003D7F89CB